MVIITKDTQVGNTFSGKLKTVTEERVYAFSGGFPRGTTWPHKNIHTDLHFAQNCGLPTRAASGAMCEGYLTELMIDLFSIDWLTYGKMSLKFIKIVDVNDIILPVAVVQSRQLEDSGVKFIMEIWCQNQYGQKVVVGTATGQVL
jgi:acyl dehydratase